MTAPSEHPETVSAASPDGRALTLWSPREAGVADRPALARFKPVAPYAIGLALVLGGGYGVATVATAPALTDAVESVAAIDARQMGLAVHLDPAGQRKKEAALGRDVGAMKTEVARLTRALDQAKANQTTQSRAVAGQAAANQDEVRTLKAEIAALQKTLDATRTSAAAEIGKLASRIEEPKPDDGRLASISERLDRIERVAPAPAPAAASPARDEPETTGGVEPPAQKVVRNWTVREVAGGVALLDSRNGMIEVMRGARVPGIGRVSAIERRDGQWVVVTTKGVILQR